MGKKCNRVWEVSTSEKFLVLSVFTTVHVYANSAAEAEKKAISIIKNTFGVEVVATCLRYLCTVSE